MKIKKIIAAVTSLALIGGAYPATSNTDILITACADEETTVSTEKEVSAEADKGEKASEKSGEKTVTPESKDKNDTETAEVGDIEEPEEECSAVFETEETVGGVKIMRVTGIKGDTLVIPAEIDGKPVVSVEDDAFNRSPELPQNVVNLKIEASLPALYGEQFLFFNSLENIEIGEGLETLDISIFSSSKETLRSLKLPDSLRDIRNRNVSYFSKLEDVTLGKGLVSIGDYAFWNCPIESIELPDSVEYIGHSAFMGCSIKSLTLPDKLASIGERAFALCDELEYVKFGSGLKRLDYSRVFENDFNLKTVEFNEGLETIGNEAFRKCYLLSKINLPSTLEKIEEMAFDCTSIAEVVIPASVKEIGAYAFTYMPDKEKDVVLTEGSNTVIIPANDAETSITVLSTDCKFSGNNVVFGLDEYDVLYGYEGSTAENYGKLDGRIQFIKLVKHDESMKLKEFIPEFNLYKLNDHTVVFPAEVDGKPFTKLVWDSSLKDTYDFTGINTIIVEGNVRDLDYSVFADFPDVAHIIIGEGIRSIGKDDLEKCRKTLKTIKLPDSLETIEEFAFINFDKLSAVELGNGIKSIGDYAFDSCAFLSSVTFPDGLRTIGIGAFERCYNLISVNIPDSLRTIDGGAFRDCYNLEEVKCGSNLVSIGKNAFDGDYNLKKVTLNEGLKELGESAFNNCCLLEEVNIPNTLKRIETGTFNETSIYDLVIPEGVEFIDSNAFSFLQSKDGDKEKTVFNYDGSELKEATIVIPKKTKELNITILNPECVLKGTPFDGEIDKIYCYNNSTAMKLYNIYELEFLDTMGDVNEDGQVDMADAVLIMQALANPNKYGLNGTDPRHITENGVRNGDVDQDSPGLTPNDALRIQEYLLGMRENF
ncbi:MAG: leucine-rich repeat protein [Ruminococcus sp.]|uniref:leucine-rich repeat protein n=1 Tax=Ruminococcus sp. TaxID=41978 RepID=UPI0025DC6F21|nr:leucine-rich repeat protein [Ruminococcus sp.]MBR5683173.1 leucine-rich repeat protein [Ruminococcus sp.]